MKEEDAMYATIRHYRVNPEVSDEAVAQIIENFAPALVEEVQGLVAYYVVNGENGSFATVTICESREVLEECSRLATQWMKQYLAESFDTAEGLTDFLFQVGPTLQGPLQIGAPKDTNKQFLQEVRERPYSEESQGLVLLSPAEVSEALGMGKSWVYQQIRSGEIPGVRLGNNLKVKRQDLEEYIETQRLQRQGNH